MLFRSGLLSPGGRVRKARPTPSPRLDISDEGVLDDEDKENRTYIVPVHASKIPVPARRMSLGDLLDSPKPNLKTKRSFVIVDKPLPSLPEGVINIDIEGGLYEYAASVIVYLKQKEKEFVLSQNFLEGGSTSIAMRSMLVDWLIQVQHHLRLCQETLYLSIMMLDTVLSKRDITSEKLQLVGVTCLLIASKLEEYYPADISKLIHLTSNSYTGRQVIKMELVIMDILGCQLYMPEIMSFLRRYVRATFRSQDTKYLKTCQYLIDVTIPEKGFSAIAPSTQAAASILAANLLFFLNSNKVIPSEDEMWSKTLIYYTGLSILDVVYTARTMIRRRAGNLLQEYNRRQMQHYWMETHIWHAKRFHIANKWGCKIPDFPNDKCWRACYRATKTKALMFDQSYHNLVEIKARQSVLMAGLERLTFPETGKTFFPMRFGLEKVAVLRDRAGVVVGEVDYLWLPQEQEEEESYPYLRLWISCHPAFVKQVLSELKAVLGVIESAGQAHASADLADNALSSADQAHTSTDDAIESADSAMESADEKENSADPTTKLTACQGKASRANPNKSESASKRIKLENVPKKNVNLSKLSTRNVPAERAPLFKGPQSTQIIDFQGTINRFTIVGPNRFKVLRSVCKIGRAHV